MADLAAGTPWGPFQIERLVGRGPSGTVYRATQNADGKPVALKLFHEELDEATLNRFEDDTRRVIGLNHPSVLRVESTGREGKRRFVVTERFPGLSLKELGPRPLRQCCEFFLRAARGISASWMRLILHRNLKPENILVSAQGDVKLADLGLFLGATPYWSPERRAGQSPDLRGDLYSLGLIFKEYLGGQDPEIDNLIVHMTRVETFERVQMVEDVISRLESCLSRSAAPAIPVPPPPPPLRLPEMPPLPSYPEPPSLPAWDLPPEDPGLLRARASMVQVLGAVAQRLQRALAHRSAPPPPPPPPEDEIDELFDAPLKTPVAAPPQVSVREEIEVPLPPERPDPGRPKPRRSSGRAVFVTLLFLVAGAGYNLYLRWEKMDLQRVIEQAERLRAEGKAAQARIALEERKRRDKSPSTQAETELLKKWDEEDWTRTKEAIRKLEGELKFAQAVEECDRFLKEHGANAPPESRTMRTALRKWTSLVEQAQYARKYYQNRGVMEILNRGGPEHAKDRERLLVRWCEEDWKEATAAVEKAVAESDVETARLALDRFLKRPHQGGVHQIEAEARSLVFQADLEFDSVADRVDSLLRARKSAEGVATWEAFLAKPHQGGSHREDVEKRLSEIKTELRVTIYAARNIVSRLVASPSGKQIAFAADRLRIMDLGSRKEVSSQPMRSLLRSIVFSGDAVLAGGASTKITLWDVEKQAELRTLPITDGYLSAMAASGDGKRLIAARSDGSLLTWDLDKDEAPRVEKDAAPGVAMMALSPDGLRAVFAGRDKTIRFRDLASAQERKWTSFAAARGLAWSPDGKRLALSGGEDLAVLDAQEGQPIFILPGHQGTVTCLTYSRNGTKLAAGGMDGSIRLWNARDGANAGVLAGHSERVTALVAVADGGLVSASADGSVKVWPLTE
jgi:serine/threonine protein kinase